MRGIEIKPNVLRYLDENQRFDGRKLDEIRKIDPHTYQVNGRVSLRDLNEELGIDLPADEVDTLAGFLLSLFNRFPTNKEKISYEGIDFIIEDIRRNRIRRVKMVVKKK